MLPKEEEKLIKEILSGKEKSLRYFYNHFQPRLLTYIKHKIDNENDAEEILQDTLLATLEGLRDFSFRCRLFTYICSIANHKVIDFYRRKKVKNIVFSHIRDLEPLLSTLLGPEEWLNEELLKGKIRKTFSLLSPKYTLILKLKYVYGYSVEEIAEKMDSSFKSTESLLFRARQEFARSYHI